MPQTRTMAEGPWICVRQRAGPLVKECRALRPRLRQDDSTDDRKDKNMIIKAQRSAVSRASVDRLELMLALFGFEGSHYTLTFDSVNLPGRFDDLRRCYRAFQARAKRWRHGQVYDYITCMEGLHGGHRYHIHMVLRDSDFSPAEVRYLWRYGEVDDEPVLLKDGGYRRLAKYFNKERPDGFIIPINKHPWSCSRGLGAGLPPPERWYSDSGRIDIPQEAIWARRGCQENDFGAYYYASYILPKRQVDVSDLDTQEQSVLLF